MQVEGELTIYWKGLPKTFTTCDYDSDELTTLLTEKFCMGMPSNALTRPLAQIGYRPHLGDLPGGRGRRAPSKDMRQRQPRPGPHMRMQSSHWRQFDEELSTYHSAKSSITHSPVRRGATNIFGAGAECCTSNVTSLRSRQEVCRHRLSCHHAIERAHQVNC